MEASASPPSPPEELRRHFRAPSPPASLHPKFQRVSVGRCHLQTANDRLDGRQFGDGAKDAVRDRDRVMLGLETIHAEAPFTWPGQGSDEELDSTRRQRSIYRRVPSMQSYRNNLTVLCQSYNLYLAAYQGRIFVYRPRTVPSQILPQRPDLQLIPQPSTAAAIVRGYIDPRRPHTINHMITGFLGDEEIVLACYDNGDVVAYYLKDVASAIPKDDGSSASVPAGQNKTLPQKSMGYPEPFFHENAGLTAWGLAIHQESRLIAVSSNRREVTVWAFALTDTTADPRTPSVAVEYSNLEARVRKRARNWRIVVTFAKEASNLPNICFLDDEDGYAEKVCAIDINGETWIADIWKTHQAPRHLYKMKDPVLRSEESYPQQSKGWGIAALPETSFMTVQTVQELIGTYYHNMMFKEATRFCPQPMAFVRRTLNEIPNDPIHDFRVQDTAVRNQAPNLSAEGQHQGFNPNLPNPPLPPPAQNPTAMAYVGEFLEVFEGWANEPSAADEDMDVDYGSSADDGEEDEEDDIEDAIEEIGEILGSVDAEEYEEDNESEEFDIASGPPVFVDGPNGLLSADAEAAISNTIESRVPTSRSQRLEISPVDRFPGKLDMVFYPHIAATKEMPRGDIEFEAFLDEPVEYNDQSSSSENGMEEDDTERPLKRYRLLRTYEKDLEMINLCKEKEDGPEVGMFSPDALVFGRYMEPTMRHHFRATSRLNMLHHIPELSLVIVGSPTGRVLLLTLTRMRQHKLFPPPVKAIWDHGFRVDWVLPLKSDEMAYRKEFRPLYGMAVGPVQTTSDMRCPSEAQRVAMPRRYRLMLHYRTHDILTYEITREEQTGKLCIF